MHLLYCVNVTVLWFNIKKEGYHNPHTEQLITLFTLFTQGVCVRDHDRR